MMSIFERLAKASRGVVEQVHGVPVTILPVSTKDVNAAPRLSATEAPYDTVACFYENTLIDSDAKVQPRIGNGDRLLNRSLIRSASIRLIDGKPLATGYFLRRHSDGAQFVITQFDPDGVGNVMAALSIARTPLQET
ncbi:MAG TPA: hypothetical protein VD840_16175 [Sinorhizobium sp.]|nr:hypothetical protein [Sinorhizobium sp.]